ncbi:MAG: LapA family protein [Rhodobiaceae bacterium]|jgi:uncharacterized integral membrane protein
MRFLGRFFWVIISLGITVVAMLFAASNNHMAIVKLWPLGGQIELATWILTLGAVCAGAIIGGGLVWLSLVAAKSRNWRLQRQLGKAEQRAAKAETRLAEAESGDATAPTSLGGPS